jgi:hypothetical protein
VIFPIEDYSRTKKNITKENIVIQLSTLADIEFADAYKAIMSEARDFGLNGFSGNCWAVAVAINRVVFNGQGKFIAGLNGPLMEKAGLNIGHASVLAREACWDADGRPKEEFDISAWGMLDFQDQDNRKLFKEHKIRWTEANTQDAGIWEFETEAEFVEACKVQESDVLEAVGLLEDALVTHYQNAQKPTR